MGEALLTYASDLDAFVQVLIDEGETDILVTPSDMISYQQRLAATGFTAQEIADAKLVGLTDADIEAYRQGIIAADPTAIAGNLLDIYTGEAAISRELGRVLLAPSSYAPGLSISGGADRYPHPAHRFACRLDGQCLAGAGQSGAGRTDDGDRDHRARFTGAAEQHPARGKGSDSFR